MDKLKVVLGKIREQSFWLATVLVLATAAVGWFLATGKLNADYTNQRRAIEGEFSKLKQINGDPNPPNDNWKDEVAKQTKVVSKKVGEAWGEIYKQQKEQVLKWPVELLGQDFVRDVERGGPTSDIADRHRRTYQNDIAKIFPSLVKLVDAASIDKQNAVATGNNATTIDEDGSGGGSVEEAPREVKVVWDSSNQQLFENALHWKQPPSALEVRNTQENLWVLQTLLGAIAKVNEPATAHYNAKIKRIEQMLIGPDAAKKFVEGLGNNRIKLPDAAAVATAAPGAADPGDFSTAPKTLAPPATAAADSAAPVIDEEGRYVDATGKPVGTAVARSEEFKRLPVYLRLRMDQREVTALIVELAKAPLPVEIRQFRLNPAGGSGGSAGGSTAGVTARPQGHGAGTAVGGGGNNRPGAKPTADLESDLTPFDDLVEMHGIVYIYNPPDKTKLLAAADAPADGDATAADTSAPSEP